MTLTNVSSDPVLLGSGELYLGVVANPESASEATIQASLVNVGAIMGGAELTYKPSVYEVNSANRGVITRFITKEDVSFKTGITTWNLDNLGILAPGFVSATGTTKRVGIGGKRTIPVNYLRFVHTKADGSGTLTVNIFKAQATEGFQFSFAQDKEVTVDAEFKALATTAATGNLVEIVEELGVSTVPTVTGLNFTTKLNSALPTVLIVTGTNFKQGSTIFLEYNGTKTDLRTLYDSQTQLSAPITTAMPLNTFAVKVRNGLIESTTSTDLTFL